MEPRWEAEAPATTGSGTNTDNPVKRLPPRRPSIEQEGGWLKHAFGTIPMHQISVILSFQNGSKKARALGCDEISSLILGSDCSEAF